jgi:hypothetical protein
LGSIPSKIVLPRVRKDSKSAKALKAPKQPKQTVKKYELYQFFLMKRYREIKESGTSTLKGIKEMTPKIAREWREMTEEQKVSLQNGKISKNGILERFTNRLRTDWLSILARQTPVNG